MSLEAKLLLSFEGDVQNATATSIPWPVFLTHGLMAAFLLLSTCPGGHAVISITLLQYQRPPLSQVHPDLSISAAIVDDYDDGRTKTLCPGVTGNQQLW